MKVLHITNEFSKKNFSIASLIVFISNYLKNHYNYDYSIISSKLDVFLFKNVKNLKIIKDDSWINFYSIFNYLKNEAKYHDFIHIHGIWSPIQLISILYFNNKKKRIAIHPHGMLLPEALQSAGIIKFFFKKITLNILQYVLNENVSFISITNQETSAIKKYFPNKTVRNIPNPVPFKSREDLNIKKEKKIVFFGRIHPHKNIDIMIDAFIKSNLSDDWSLEIYGIRDDENYYQKLKNKIKNKVKINIFEPIFEKEKQLKMSSAWLNILLSKSEVLSLSILESSQHGLPTLVNKSIEIIDNNNATIQTSLELEEILRNIKNITSWTEDQRIDKETDIKKSFKNKVSISDISNKYQNLYNEQLIFNKDVSKLNLESKFSRWLNFFVITSNYTFNLMFASLLVVFLVLFGFFSQAGELGLLVSFWITTTQIFSSNMRGIITANNKIEDAKNTLIYRFIFSMFALVIFYFILNNFFNFNYNDLIFNISILIMAQWSSEMKLLQYELQKKKGKLYIFLATNVIFTLLTILILFLRQIDLLNYLLPVYTILVILFSLGDIFDYALIGKNKIKNIYYSILLNTNTIAFISSFSIVISSFSWRLMIYYLFDKSVAGIFFACFSVGSFPGTLFNSIIGPTFVREKIKISNVLKGIFLIFFVFLLSLFFKNIIDLSNSNIINLKSLEFVLTTISISLIGSYFMSYAMFLRHVELQKDEKKRKLLFRTDIIYGSSITILIPLLFYTLGALGVSFSFFLASMTAFIFYSTINKNFNN